MYKLNSMTDLPKRLIEVDLSICGISKEAAAEMKKWRGHILMMHIWWLTVKHRDSHSFTCRSN